MSMLGPVDDLFVHEWDRFKKGIATLDPGAGVGPITGTRRDGPPAPGMGTITIPGWDDVIRLGHGPTVGGSDFGDYYKNLRKPGSVPQDPAIKLAIQKILAASAATKSSTQPGYSQAIGQVMTAIDNSQDFIATVATIGRLLIWAAPRVGLRFVPVVGWIVLAADILNLFNFVGMVATPLYALLCAGPRDALVAGVPAALLKNALCKEAWTQAMRNPFSKAARANRRMRSMGRLPGVSNWIEALQVTETLFGVGISLGGLYGAAVESLYAFTGDGSESQAEINTNLLLGSFTHDYKPFIAKQSTAQRAAVIAAARNLQMAPLIAGQHDMFDDELHIAHMATLPKAVQLVAEFLRLGPVDAMMEHALPGRWPAPSRRPAWFDAAFPGMTDADAGFGTWWVPGNPRELDGDTYALVMGKQVSAGVNAFLKPRRNRPELCLFGAACTTATEHVWHLIAGDGDALTWQLEPDYIILTSMMVEGLLVVQGEHEGRLWRFWTALRAEVARKGGRMLERDAIERAERDAGITLMRLLSPDAQFPPQWMPYFRNPSGFGPWPPKAAPHLAS